MYLYKAVFLASTRRDVLLATMGVTDVRLYVEEKFDEMGIESILGGMSLILNCFVTILLKKPYRVRQECQRLANLCVLQMYSRGTFNKRAMSICKLYVNLLAEDVQQSSHRYSYV